MAKIVRSDAVAEANDETEIEAGMILTAERGIGYTDSSGRRRITVREENLDVTGRGARLLTRHAS